MTNLYASVPYITGHSIKADSSVAWMNGADTWVHIHNYTTNNSHVSFVSESGTLEFFAFATTLGPQRTQRMLADITGYP